MLSSNFSIFFFIFRHSSYVNRIFFSTVSFVLSLILQTCLSVLTKEEALSAMERDEIRVEVDHSVLRFLDLARQMEAFFLQKRFLLSALKPELVVKEVFKLLIKFIPV